MFTQTDRQPDRQVRRQTDSWSFRQADVNSDRYIWPRKCLLDLKSASTIARKRNQKAHLAVLL